jgi:hypothetical protein
MTEHRTGDPRRDSTDYSHLLHHVLTHTRNSGGGGATGEIILQYLLSNSNFLVTELKKGK